MSDDGGSRPGEEEFGLGEEEQFEGNYRMGDGDYQPDGQGEEENLEQPNGDEEMFDDASPEERNRYLAASGLGSSGADGGMDAGDDPNQNNRDNDELGDGMGAYEEEVPGLGRPTDSDDEDDIPEYANEQNKNLAENIKTQKKETKKIILKIDELKGRLNELKTHQKFLLIELKNTEMKIELKKEQADSEKHLSQLADREIGKITADLRRLDADAVETQDRLNDIQQEIFKGNEELEKLKLEITWNKEEKQQWIIAEKQKEEDNMSLAKYKRMDDNKIKELSLQLERLTIAMNTKQAALDKEVTETQAIQIEIDKKAEEFKQLRAARNKYYTMWDDSIQAIGQRHDATLKITTRNVEIQIVINRNLELLDEKKKQLSRETKVNRDKEKEIQMLDKEIEKQKKKYEDLVKEHIDLDASIKVNKNTLSADSSRQAQTKNNVEMLMQELQIRKERLTNAEKKYKAQVEILKSEKSIELAAIEMEQRVAQDYEAIQKALLKMDTKIKEKKDNTYKRQAELMKLRESEAHLYSEIQGTMAANRNLQSQITKLQQEISRQHELLYNAAYQIQFLERKVAKANGEKTSKETTELTEKIKDAQSKHDVAKAELDTLQKALRTLADEKRKLERDIKAGEDSKARYTSVIEKLNLENDMTLQELENITNQKKDTMVQHNIMKLEILKIQGRLRNAQDQVFELENKKNQLELGLSEREKEVEVHRGVLLAEFKAAEQEKHKIAVELSNIKSIVSNNKIKYESLVQKKVGSNGVNIYEHSQAYYMIKAGQEKEELQRREDELKAQIGKAMSELNALINTRNHLLNQNANYRDKFMNKGWSEKEVELKVSLDEQLKVVGDNLMKKRKDFDRTNAEIERLTMEFNERQSMANSNRARWEELSSELNACQQENQKQVEKLSRAQGFYDKSLERLKKKKVDFEEVESSSTQILSAKIEQANNVRKTLQSAIQ